MPDIIGGMITEDWVCNWTGSLSDVLQRVQFKQAEDTGEWIESTWVNKEKQKCTGHILELINLNAAVLNS